MAELRHESSGGGAENRRARLSRRYLFHREYATDIRGECGVKRTNFKSPPPPLPIIGLFRDCYYGPFTPSSPSQPASGSVVRLTDVHTPSRTILLSEIERVRTWNDNAADNNGSLAAPPSTGIEGFVWWDVTNGAITPNSTVMLTFYGLGVNTTVTPNTSIHPGIVNVTFCDGHVESLSDDAQCGTYSVVP